jgi:hypothetical protein
VTKAILYYLAAGAVGVGGPAAARFLLRLAQQEAAAHTLSRGAESTARYLQLQIDQASLREQALAVGVDPDVVVHAFREMQDRLGNA